MRGTYLFAWKAKSTSLNGEMRIGTSHYTKPNKATPRHTPPAQTHLYPPLPTFTHPPLSLRCWRQAYVNSKARAIYSKNHEGSEKCAKPSWKRGKTRRRAGKGQERSKAVERNEEGREDRNEETRTEQQGDGGANSSSTPWQTAANMSHNRQGVRKNGQQVGSNLGKRSGASQSERPQQE